MKNKGIKESHSQTQKEKFIILWFAISFCMVVGIDVDHTGIIGFLLVLFNFSASVGVLLEHEDKIKKRA